MTALAFWSIVLPAMIAGCVLLYRSICQDEAPATQRERARDAVMAASMTDDSTCTVCSRVTAVRELVMLYDGAELACAGCSAILSVRRAAA